MAHGVFTFEGEIGEIFISCAFAKGTLIVINVDSLVSDVLSDMNALLLAIWQYYKFMLSYRWSTLC